MVSEVELEAFTALPPFHVKRWCGWTPALNSSADWISHFKENSGEISNIFEGEASPSIDFLPLALRKKLSQLTKVSLHLAQHCLTEEERAVTPTVFASRHGEGAVTIEMLEAIAASEGVSPMGFSRSVHNTPSALFAIASGNTAPSTSIAAGKATFRASLTEAVLQATCAPQGSDVLLVYGEELLSPFFKPYVQEHFAVWGVAFLIAKGGSGNKIKVDDTFPSALRFLQRVIEQESI